MLDAESKYLSFFLAVPIEKHLCNGLWYKDGLKEVFIFS